MADGVKLNILSLNVRDLNNPVKRVAILDFLRKQRINIAFLQETHLVNRDTNHMSNRFFRVLASSSASNKSKGVMIICFRLHWLPIAAHIKFKVLMFAYKTTTGTAPIYLNLLVQTYAPSRSLRSASERRLVVPSQRGTKSLSRTFSWTVPSWWNDLPISIRTAESLAIFKKTSKDTSFLPAPD